MKILTVTTISDVVDRTDGVLSLREAVAKAGRLDKAVEVRFDQDTFSNGPFKSAKTIQLEKQLVFKSGIDILIDGTLETPGLFFSATIAPAADGDTAMMIAGGAKVTFRDLAISGGPTSDNVIGADGPSGKNGLGGVAGTSARDTYGKNGGDGGDGVGAPDPDEDVVDPDAPVQGGDGAMAIGGIINEGELILDHVLLQSLGAQGGDGHYGGSGGRAGKGGDSGHGDSSIIGGQGGKGGLGGEGTRGGDGGNAVGAIMNYGKLTVHDVDFSNNFAEGGRGGQGGNGGNGGHGGNFGSPGPLRGVRYGGDGGNGGDGGRGGHGGDAASDIWNLGEVIFQGIQGTPGSTAKAGDGNDGGTGGVAGSGGISWAWVLSEFPRPEDGRDGLFGTDGADGKDGLAESFIGVTPKLGTVFLLTASGTTITEVGSANERGLILGVEKIGDHAGEVNWRIKPGDGVDADDFLGGFLPGGKLDFSASDSFRSISFRMAVDAEKEGKEFFTVELFNSKGGKISSSHEVEIKIKDDGNLEPINGTVNNDKKLTGTKDADYILGLKGNDNIKGLDGHDVIFGGKGKDKLLGALGDDELNGGTGNDVILGGKGYDILSGGGGADRFVFANSGSENLDFVRDFTTGTDGIDIVRKAFSGIGPKGELDSNALVIGTEATDGDHRVIYNSITGSLSVDVDGSGAGAAVQIAWIGAGLSLGADDFMII